MRSVLVCRIPYLYLTMNLIYYNLQPLKNATNPNNPNLHFPHTIKCPTRFGCLSRLVLAGYIHLSLVLFHFWAQLHILGLLLQSFIPQMPNKPIFSIWSLLILILCAFLLPAQRILVSRPITSQYNQYGAIQAFLLQWKPYYPIFTQQLIKVTFPEPIHGTDSSIFYSLSTAHSLELVDLYQSLPYTGANSYFLPVTQDLSALAWYQIKIMVNSAPLTSYGLVRLSIVGSISSTDPFISEWNNGYEYYHLEQNQVPSSLLQLNLTGQLSTAAGARQKVLLEVMSLIQINETVDLYFDFYDTTMNLSALDQTSTNVGAENGFSFVGSCYSSCSAGYTCIHEDDCEVAATYIKITLPYMHIGQQYLVEAYVLNPQYVSTTSIEAYWKDDNQKTIAIAFADQVLSVQPITVQAELINLLWGIPYDTVVTQMGLGLFVNDPAVTSQSLSSFDIGFSVSAVTPIQGSYIVKVRVGALQVLEESINHNLPSLKSTTDIRCRYELPDIICEGVDAFTLVNSRYYVRARGYFTTADDLSQFGDVSIAASDSSSLFVPLTRNLVVQTITNADYHDYTGLHDPLNGYRIKQTLLASHLDTLLPNSTDNSIKDFLRNPQSFVGVDPLTSPLQLQFFMKVGLDQMSLPSPASFPQKYVMKIFTNPNVLNSSSLGVDFAAYSPSANSWGSDHASCYQDTSLTPTTQDYRCQKYNDYVYNGQYDNTFSKTSNYGVYNWMCGQGQKVTCPSGDCAADCQILKGGFSNTTTISDADGGVISIRNVTILKNYHSPVQANKYNFDFIFAFYQDQTLVSASLINAYTINSTRLSNISATIINSYHDSSASFNPGDRIPTLIKLHGHLSLKEAGNTYINSLRVYLPSSITAANFLSEGSLGCSTNECYGSVGGLTAAEDTWVQQESVQIFSLPHLTEQFTILIPVQYTSATPVLSIVVTTLSTDGTILGVYRINGSSVSQSLSGSINYLKSPVLATTVWNSGLSNWVDDSANVYKQALSLSLIKPFSVSNTISMLGSTMSSTDVEPSSTFASAHLNIFSASSTASVDSVIACVNPFSYTYMNLYPVYVLWCPLASLAVNDIVIKYPLYPVQMGASFPYQLTFAYAYSNDLGHMKGYRLEGTSGGNAQACQTVKNTEYQRDATVPQENQITISLTPFPLSQLQPLFAVKYSPPTELPMTALSCSALETSLDLELACVIASQAANVITLELTYGGTEQIMVYEVSLRLKVVRSSASTVTTSVKYKVEVYLPYTDALLMPSMGGTLYSPYSSQIATCLNSFTYSSYYTLEYIQLSNAQLVGHSKNFYSSITFDAEFGSARSTFFSTSLLQITFSQPILTSYSRCLFDPDYGYWATSNIDSTFKIVTLTPYARIQGFSGLYTINCTSVYTNGNDVTITMKWVDGAYTIAASQSPVTASHTALNTVITSSSATLICKLFGTANYLAQYEIALTISSSGNDKVELYADFPHAHVHSEFLECSYLNGSTWEPVLCFVGPLYSLEQIYISLRPISSSTCTIRVYGVLQEQQTAADSISILGKKTNLATSAISYWKFIVSDVVAGVLTTEPIIIEDVVLDPLTGVLNLTYVLPISHSTQFYLSLDQLVRLQYGAVMTCYINSTAVSCSRVRPNLILISSTRSHLSLSKNYLCVKQLHISSYQEYDSEEIHFGLFIASSDLTTVRYGSHEHLQQPLLTSTLTIPEQLIWSIPSNQFNSKCQVAYLGYFGLPASLISSQASSFRQSFNMTASVVLQLLDLAVQLGTSQELLYTANMDSTMKSLHYVSFATASSEYSYVPSLPVCFSVTKCQLITQFKDYNIFSGGITIPIAINMSACRPVNPLTVTAFLNTTYIEVEQTLTTQTIDTFTDMIYVVLRHSYTNTTIRQTFSLQIEVSSTDALTNDAFLDIAPVLIHVVNSSILVGNPEGKQPVINSLTADSVNFTIECNSPATIYWGIGLYPTMLGISSEEIEARLIESSNGLQSSSKDIYSWSEQLYGLSYSAQFNEEKVISIEGLKGSQDYVFKYYCVDQTGRSSGGKISYITTPASNYSLTKVTLSFEDALTYQQTNSIACAISEQLTVPYYQTITSTATNCINQTEVYHALSDTLTDQLSSSLHQYFFYVDSQQVASSAIVSTLYDHLGHNTVFLTEQVPYYKAMRVDRLQNNYEPQIYSSSLSIKRTSFTLTIEVGLANTYLIAAVMSEHFDSATMSMPTHYLMKQGFFSSGNKFDQVQSVFGRNSISAEFVNLTGGHNYSVFYFSTVDNSALNSRHSQVKYLDLTTSLTQLIDLSGLALSLVGTATILLLALSLS